MFLRLRMGLQSYFNTFVLYAKIAKKNLRTFDKEQCEFSQRRVL